MGNVTNRDQWAGQERLRFIERRAWWNGVVNRRDLTGAFGMSAAQASADIQAYLQLNPDALRYNLRSKRYEASPEMNCTLHEPQLRDVLGGEWIGEHVAAPVPAERVTLPVRKANAQVERRVFIAVDGGRRIRVRYWSVHRARPDWREIAPHAFAHDGYRWHMRAWCFENEDFRDFVLSRIERAEWPGDQFEPPGRDEDWESFDEMLLRPNHKLSADQQKAIARDYGMRTGKLRLTVRRALKRYWLAHLRLPDKEGELPAHLEFGET